MCLVKPSETYMLTVQTTSCRPATRSRVQAVVAEEREAMRLISEVGGDACLRQLCGVTVSSGASNVRLAHASLIVRPHSQNTNRLLCCKNLVYKPVLDIDAP